jgi:hypothetical protein
MKNLKQILIAIAVLIAIPLVVALFIKENYHVEREIVINQPKDEVFNYVKYLKNQDNYSKWASIDPEMKKTFTGTDGTVGFVSRWESTNEEVGVGEQEIKGITEGEKLDFELRFYEPFEATDNAFMTTESISDSSTKVKWGFDGSMAYPMNLMLLFMDMEEMLGNDLQQGLNNLKVVLEK